MKKTSTFLIIGSALSSLFISCSSSDNDNNTPIDPIKSPYITKVLDYRPAVGQFVNEMPKYEEGDTQETMNQKVLKTIGKENHGKDVISLGGYGGYVVVGFDHTIRNEEGKRDFRVLGNAFQANGNDPLATNAEPGIIMVAYDKNKNGKPDDNEWYEIAGSAHQTPIVEAWLNTAKEQGNDVSFSKDYEITYYKPTSEPTSQEDYKTYIKWEDNMGNNGYKTKNTYHNQSYYPKWITENKLSFKGSKLPQNGIDKSGNKSLYILYKFDYGYADNDINSSDNSAIDIDWAIDKNGNKVHLEGVDFIKIYTGVNQEYSNIGENSTEIAGIEDLHLLGIDISSN